MIKVFLILTFVVMLFGCNNIQKPTNGVENSDEIKSTEKTFETKFKYLKNIKVEYYKDYKIIKLINPWDSTKIWQTYLLYFNEKPNNENLPKTDFQIKIPVNRIAVMSASTIGFLDAISSVNRVCAVSKKQYVYNDFVRRNIENNSIVEIGESELINYEKLISARPDIFIQTPYDDNLKRDKIIANSGIPVVYNPDWLETNPLGRAEWIKFIALFLNKEYAADSVFNKIETTYLKLKEDEQKELVKPSVIVGIPFKEIWYMPAGESYKAKLMSDAGLSYFGLKTKGKGSLALGFETVFKNYINSDYWLEVPFYNYQEMISYNSNYKYFKAFELKNVFNHQKQMHSDGANNYWERGVCFPNEVLSDLINIIHSKDLNNLNYYQKLDSVKSDVK